MTGQPVIQREVSLGEFKNSVKFRSEKLDKGASY